MYKITMQTLKNESKSIDFINNSLGVFENSAAFKDANTFLDEGGGRTNPNIGEFGFGRDYSNATLAHPIQTTFPLVTFLLNTPMAAAMRSFIGSDLFSLQRSDNNLTGWSVPHPPKVHTLAPPDTSGKCCWRPIDIDFCEGKSDIALVCIEDHLDITERIIDSHRRAGGNDMYGFWQRRGETVADARRRWTRINMAWYTSRNLVLGDSYTETETLKPMHGLMEVLERESVLNLDGLNLLAQMEIVHLRLSLLRALSGAVVWVHPLGLEAIRTLILPDNNGNRPDGWTVTTLGDISFRGIPFRTDDIIPVDLYNNTTEAYVLNGASIFGWLATDLMPPTDSIYHIEDWSGATSSPENCGAGSEYWYNMGVVDSTNDEHVMLISGIPLSGNATGIALDGIESLINPTTLVPRTGLPRSTAEYQ